MSAEGKEHTYTHIYTNMYIYTHIYMHINSCLCHFPPALLFPPPYLMKVAQGRGRHDRGGGGKERAKAPGKEEEVHVDGETATAHIRASGVSKREELKMVRKNMAQTIINILHSNPPPKHTRTHP